MDRYSRNKPRESLYESSNWTNINDIKVGIDNASYMDYSTGREQNTLDQGRLLDPRRIEEEMKMKYGRTFDPSPVTGRNGTVVDALKSGTWEEERLRESERGGEDFHDTQGQAWKNICFNFTQNTSMHGVNKVTERTPFVIRR